MPGQTFSTRPRGYVQTPEDAPGFWQLGNLWRIMASGYQTGNALCLIDQLVTPKGGGPGAHMHPSDEGLYVVSGHCTFYAGGETVSAGAGSLVFVPRFTEHAFSVDAPGTQLLNYYLPSGFELFVMGFSHPAECNELPREGEVPMPSARLVEQLSRDYGQIGVTGVPLPGIDPPTPDQMATRPNPDAAVQPYLATADASARWWHDGQLWSVLADGARTDGSFSVFDILAPRGTGAPPHLFVEADAFYYVLEGEVEMLLGDNVKPARKGDFVFVPKGTPHARRVTSDAARLLHLLTPSGFERVLGAFGERTTSQTPPPTGWGGPQVADDRRRRLFDDIGMRRLAERIC